MAKQPRQESTGPSQEEESPNARSIEADTGGPGDAARSHAESQPHPPPPSPGVPFLLARFVRAVRMANLLPSGGEQAALELEAALANLEPAPPPVAPPPVHSSEPVNA